MVPDIAGWAAAALSPVNGTMLEGAMLALQRVGNIMAVQITHVRFNGYARSEETIVRYKWLNPSDGTSSDNDKTSMVDFLDNQKGEAYVGSGPSKVAVGVVHPATGQPYLRTHADSKWTNNLVNLPTF